MKMISTIVLTLAALAVIGCEPPDNLPRAYQVGYGNGLPIGAFSPNLPLITTQGEQTLFGRVAGPIMVVVFLAPTGPECCQIKPELVELAKDFQYGYVSVVQVSLPTSLCPHGPGCVEVCSMFDKHLILLCDKDTIAWNQYWQPEPGTVFLVDADNIIVDVDTFQNLETIENKARRLSDKIRDEYEEAFEC